MVKLIPRREYSETNDSQELTIGKKSHTRTTKLQNLSEMVGEKQKKIFVKKLFDGNESEYSSFVNNLNKLNTWKEALTTIEQNMSLRNKRTDSSEMTIFSNLVYRRYFPEDDNIDIF